MIVFLVLDLRRQRQGIFLGDHGMWRRRLYHRCEQLFKEKISGRRKRRGRKKRRKWIRGQVKSGFEKSRGFSTRLSFLPSLSLSLSPNYPQNLRRILWEIGLNRFFKDFEEELFRMTTQLIVIRDIQTRIQSIKNRSLDRRNDNVFQYVISS